MDKYEYKHLVDQIHYLIEQQEYAKAADIADTIDWRRVRSIMTLGTVSDLYRINRRYEDARDIMLMAYDRKPESSQVCYSLCELFLKTKEMADAVEFYKEYERLTKSDDFGRYILKYKMYVATETSLEERAEVLEKLRQIGRTEKWLYELAYLYHRMELETKCVEICDELILWFGEGDYVNKALELKRLHAPLTPEQQAKYDRRFEPEEFAAAEGETESAYEEEGLEEHTWSGEQDTGEIFEGIPEDDPAYNSAGEFGGEEAEGLAGEFAPQDTDTGPMVKIMDMGQYNTMNLQAEIAAGVNEVLGTDYVPTHQPPKIDPKTGYYDIGSTTEILNNLNLNTAELGSVGAGTELQPGDEAGDSYAGYVEGESSEEEAEPSEGTIADRVMEQMRLESLEAQKKLENEALTAQPPEPMARALTQEPDGQIRLVLPEGKKLEKQITGQLSIEDIRAEWERMKQESREKQEEEVRQRVQRQTGKMFTEFEEALRDNILKQMEKKDDPSLFGISEDPQETGEGDNDPEQEDEWNMKEWMSDTGEDSAGEPEGTEGAMEEPEETPEGTEGAMEEPEETTEEAEGTMEEPEETPEETEGSVEEPEETAETMEEADPMSEETGEAPEEMEGVLEETAESSIEHEKLPEETGEVSDEPEGASGETSEEEEEMQKETEESSEITEMASTGDTWGDDDEVPNFAEEEAGSVEEVGPEETGEAEEPAVEAGTGEETDKASDEEQLGETSEEERKEQKSDGKTSQEDTQESSSASSQRSLTEEEEALFGELVQDRSAREQLVKAIDSISMAAYAGNLVITSEEKTAAMEMAKNMVREIKQIDSNFSGKVARISGGKLKGKKASEFLEQLKNGAMIIDNASMLSEETQADLYKCMQQESYGLLMILIDTKKKMNLFLKENKKFASMFSARVDLQPLSNDVLAEYAQQYAREREFSIDDLGMLALHTRIDELQTAKHSVTKAEVEEIMDAAMESAAKKNMGHFFDILVGRRYDDEDMIIITEKDFE